MEDRHNNEADFKKTCINCGRRLIERKGALLCLQCNPEAFEYTELFEDSIEDGDYVFIECPGASLYRPGTNEVVAGARFIENGKLETDFEIIKEPVFAPTHKKRRRIKREALGRIRRCQGCQDYTVRMRRPEGADFFIPSYKHPKRKKLKSVEHTSYEPK